MDPKQKNTLLAAGIASGLFSLPTTWMTIRNAELQIESVLGNLSNPTFSEMTIDITGLNGHVTMLFKTPLWFVVGVAMMASILQLMKSSNAFAIPKMALWVVAVAAMVWITLPTLLALSSGKVTLGIGWLLGVFCAIAPLFCLVIPNSKSPETSPDSPVEPEHGKPSVDS